MTDTAMVVSPEVIEVDASTPPALVVAYDPATTAVVVEVQQAAQVVVQDVIAVEISQPGSAPSDGAGAAPETRTASETLGGHRMVRSTYAGAAGYVSCDNPLHGDDTIGMTLGAADAGAPVLVQTAGPVTFAGWSWTPGESVFAGRSGLLTQIPPSPEAGDAFGQVVGHAESATTFFLQIAPPVYFD